MFIPGTHPSLAKIHWQRFGGAAPSRFADQVSGDAIVNLLRQATLQHPLAQRFASEVESLGVPLAPASTRLYHGTARSFLPYLGADHPEVVSLDPLRRDPHILGWMAQLRSRVPRSRRSLTSVDSYSFGAFSAEPASGAQLPELAHSAVAKTLPAPLDACPVPSPRNRINSSSKNCCAATISVGPHLTVKFIGRIS